MARPVRLVLASQLGSDIDGAWWPHTASVASELPELIGVLHASLGEIVDIGINWSPTEGPVDELVDEVRVLIEHSVAGREGVEPGNDESG